MPMSLRFRSKMAKSSTSETFPDSHHYDGLHLLNSVTPAALDALQSFKFYSEDLLILGYPKSGNNWLNEIAWLVTHNANTEEAINNYLEDRVTYLERHHSHRDEPEVHRISKVPPRIMKSHLPARFLEKQLKDSCTKVIIIIRDVKDTLVSYFNYLKANKTISDISWHMFFELFKKKQLTYGDWADFYQSWLKYKENQSFLFLTYEDLKNNPAEGVRMIARHCDKNLTEEQVQRIVQYTCFTEMKGNPKVIHPRINGYFRKGVIGDWVNYFSTDQLLYIEQYEKTLYWLV